MVQIKRIKNGGKNPSPSPDHYKINDSFTRKTSSSWGLGYGQKIDLSKSATETPGPGSYQSPTYITEGKKYQMGIRKDMFQLKSDRIPGPGSYQPNHEKGKSKSPEYRFGSEKRLKTAGKQSIPNPQTYNIKDDFMHKTASAWGMGYGQKIDLSKAATETPGPGSYQFNSHITEGKKYGMRIRKDMFKLEDQKYAPGPGAYSPDEFKTKNKSPHYRFGTDSRLKDANRNPVPNPQSYNIKDDFMHKTASSWGMGYGQKIDLSKTLAFSPGPGSYEYKSSIAEGKKYGIGHRTDMFQLKRDGSPGPGHYKAEVVDLKRNAQSFKVGKGSRFDSNIKSRKEGPGPGMYSTQINFGGPKYGFGTGLRPQNTGNHGSSKDIFPGPGHYNQDRSFNNIKSYESAHTHKASVSG